MNITIHITDHAARRMAQRNLSIQDVCFVWDNGRRIYSGGALHVFLGDRDIPQDKRTEKSFGHLIGAVLVVHEAGNVAILLTVYRNRQAPKCIRAKAKYHHSTPRKRYSRNGQHNANEVTL